MSIHDPARQRDLGIYIHIPFCVRKCDYCDFLSAPGSEAQKKEYMKALRNEIMSYQGRTRDYKVPTIFFGGGTPSCIDGKDVFSIMEAINEVFFVSKDHPEITMEVNPGTVNREKLCTYQEAGINRLSFGLQSADPQELKDLGRIHTYEEFERNFYLARELGFDNINVDLMSALPGQTLASWEKTLQTIIDLKPEHISAYSLIIEENTKFYDRYGPGAGEEAMLPDEDTDRLMYSRTKKLLQEYGYHRYEISNYALPGYECRHNDSYWTGVEYLGLGLGSSSLLKHTRYSNVEDIALYLSCCGDFSGSSSVDVPEKSVIKEASITTDPLHIHREQILLTREQQIEEFMFLGLRRCEGVNTKEFLQRFLKDIDSVYGDTLRKLESNQLLERTEDRIRLTEYGIDISNTVLAEFLFD